MRSLLTALLLCLQFVSLGIAQQPLPSPPPPAQQPKPKPENQKPSETQQPRRDDDVDIVKITTNLVQIDAIVTDNKGKRVTDLRADEVEIQEDGRAKNISNFSYVSLESKSGEPPSQTNKAEDRNAPAPPIRLRPEQVKRTMALVVDDLGLSFESAHYVRQTLKKFVDQQMQADDLVAIIRTGGGIGALQQFTSDKRQLYAAVEKVRWNPIGRGGVTAFAPLGSEPEVIPSDLQDKLGQPVQDLNQFREDIFAVGTLGALNYVVRGLKELPGRKSVVLFSDGFKLFTPNDPTGNVRLLTSLRRLIDLANRASVVIYTMDARGLPVIGLTAADNTGDMSAAQVEEALSGRRDAHFESQAGLDYLATRTGGLAFRNTNDLSGSVKKIIADQDGYYLIGYRPDDDTFTQVKGRAKFHNVSLKIKRPGKYNVRMRNGFYGVSDETLSPVAQTPQQQIINALTSPFGASGIQVRLTSLFLNDAKLGSAMHSFLHVNTKDIDFTEEPDGMRKAVVEVVALTFGDNGQVVDQASFSQTLQIKKENFDRAQKNGITYNLTVPIKKAGAYQFRIALRDRSSGRVGSSSQFIEVPDIKKNRLLLSGIVMKGMSLETYLKSARSGNYNTNEEIGAENLPNASTAVRQFRTGMALVYAFTIYNAQIDKTTGKPNLKSQIRIFRNGAQLFAGNETPYDVAGETDLKRLIVSGGVQLGSIMTPGEYVLQVIVTDSVKEKPRVTSQWLDFEIVK